MVHPTSFRQLDSYLNRMGIPYQITDEDLLGSIKRSFNYTNNVAMDRKNNKKRRGHSGFNLQRYNSHKSINNWMDKLAYKRKGVKSIIMGKTYEGRKQKVLRI